MRPDEAPPSSGRQRLHDRRREAGLERLRSGRALPTRDEIAERVKRARESGQGLTVEHAAMDSGAVLGWWFGEEDT